MNARNNDRVDASDFLEERGLFWWNDQVLEEPIIVPDAHIAGVLRVETNGRIVLELDGCLPNPKGPFASISQGPVVGCIQGLLKGSSERVLLSDLHRSGGGFRTNGISYDRFTAEHGLLSSTSWPSGKDAPRFTTQLIPLTGFEEWLRLGRIKAEHAPGSAAASYVAPGDIEYATEDGALALIFNIEAQASGGLGTHAWSVKQTAFGKLSVQSEAPLAAFSRKFLLFEDLLKLLTGQDYALAWPSLMRPDGSLCRWFFQRTKDEREIEVPSHYNTITFFPELREQFGAIWARWNAMREAFGPGMYLYFATRRGLPMYIEHRFVNFAWGLEALHRKRASQPSTAMSAKIKRVLASVGAKDRKWLARRLRHTQEPALDQRLFDTFKVLDLGLDKKRLRQFCEACAKRRNDISHFGGERHGESYTAFLEDVKYKGDALATLYHALLLHECGIDPEILRRWIFKSWQSFQIKFALVKTGLLDPEALRLPEPPKA